MINKCPRWILKQSVNRLSDSLDQTRDIKSYLRDNELVADRRLAVKCFEASQLVNQQQGN